MNWRFTYYDINKGIDWAGIEKDFSWFRDMRNVPQDAIWHAEGDVHTHTKMVVVSLVNLPEFKLLDEQDKHIVFLAALMHDIEKRSTTTSEERDGRTCIVAPRHAQKGEKTVRGILYRDLDTPFEIREEICSLVRYHGVPLWSFDDKNSLHKIINISQRCQTNLLCMLAKADVLGRVCEDSEDLLEKVEFFELMVKEQECFGKPKEFKTKLSRYSNLINFDYLGYDYEPYDKSRFSVIMLSGISGSGKDTFIQEEYSKLPVISLDGIRRELGIRPEAKKANGKVFQIAKERCKVLMRKGVNFVFNATNITKNMRSKWVTLFEAYSGKVTIEYIEVPYEKLLKQNSNREYKVPEKIIEKMIKKLEIPLYNEAYDVQYNIN